MLIIKITRLSFWLLACSLSLSAQSNYQPASPPYTIQRFSTDNGLPSNGIKGLQWDEKTGFLWIATEAGIARYNGADFLVFNRATSPQMYSERMLFLLRTRDGRIYSSDETGDLFLVMQNKLEFVGQAKIDTRPTSFKLTGLVASGRMFRQSSRQPPPEFGFNWFQEQLVPLSESRLLLTHNDSLYDYRAGLPTPVFIATLAPGSRIFYLQHNLFVFHPAYGFYRLDPDSPAKRPVTLDSLEKKPVTPGGPEKTTGKPLLFWDNGMQEPILVEGSKVWALGYSGDKLRSRLICTVLPRDALIGFVKYDSAAGMLFVGTQSKGIIIIRKNEVRTVRKALATPDQPTAYYSQIALPAGSFLANRGDVLGGGNAPPVQGRGDPPQVLAMQGTFNNFVFCDPDSVFWYSRSDTVYGFSLRTHRLRGIYAGAGSITNGFAASDGHLYIANAIGIGELKADRVEYLYRYPQANINSNCPFSMTGLDSGRIAVATCNGLFRYDIPAHRLDTLLHIPGICVRALWMYKGYLFVGTYGRGIWLYRRDVIRPIPLDKKGYLQYAHCFVPDRSGYCWISTNHGLFRARADDMTEAFGKRNREIYYHYYGREEGMDMTELNGGCTPCALALNDTILSFPSMDGLVWVNPRATIPSLPEGSIYIDSFIADSQRVNITSIVKPELPANTRDLSFNLAFPAWTNRENLNIEFRLEPWSKDWEPLDLGHGPELHFSNLPNGDYRLLIRKANGFGSPHFALAVSSFYIRPHWYQQPWSWLLGICLFSGLVITLVRWRTRRFHVRQYNLEKQIAEKTRELQVKNEELEKTDLIKTRLISIISHDLVTPLRFLHLTGKNLIEKKEGLTEALMQEAIAEMATTSKELELLSTNILNWIKYRNEDRRLAKENFDLHELVTQLCSIFNAMARQKQLRLINGVEEGLSLYQYIEPVKIVLYNLILNGINFTTEGYIRVSSIRGRDGVALQIQDTGVGMTQEQINNIMADQIIISSANVDNRKGNGLGYLIIKDLLKILRGNLNIRSGKEKGTTVTVWIPA
jgi:signal transduction histidine kinase